METSKQWREFVGTTEEKVSDAIEQARDSARQASKTQSGRAARDVAEQMEDAVAPPATNALWRTLFLGLAGVATLGSLGMFAAQRKHESLFMGQWVPVFVLIALWGQVVRRKYSREATGRRSWRGGIPAAPILACESAQRRREMQGLRLVQGRDADRVRRRSFARADHARRGATGRRRRHRGPSIRRTRWTASSQSDEGSRHDGWRVRHERCEALQVHLEGEAAHSRQAQAARDPRMPAVAGSRNPRGPSGGHRRARRDGGAISAWCCFPAHEAPRHVRLVAVAV